MIAILIIVGFITYLLYPTYSLLEKLQNDSLEDIDCDDDVILRVLDTPDPGNDFVLNLFLKHVFKELNFKNARSKLMRHCNVNSSSSSSK